MTRTGAIILAAGRSIRMGRPKQLIPWKGRPLVLAAVENALATGASPVWVVTGAHAREVETAVGEKTVRFLRNERYAEGMGSSIAAGFRAVMEDNSTERVFLLLCDQPAVKPGLLQRMEAMARETGRKVVACSYAGTIGPPLLVEQPLYRDFAGCPPETGARRILQRHSTALATVPFPGGAFDLDTPGDLEKSHPG